MEYRKHVVDSLYRILENKKYSNIEVINSINDFSSKMEKDLYVFNLYGVIENLIFIDWVIAKYSSVKINKINLKVLNILRLAIFQLFFANKLSESKIVFESVDTTKKYLYKSFNFVNAILRNVIRNKTLILNEIEELDKTDYLSIKYSYPKEFLIELINEFGYEDAEKYCIASNSKPDTIVRVNSSLISRDEFYNNNSSKLILEKTKISKYGIIIKNPNKISEIEEYKSGLITPQDETSMLVAEILNPDDGALVLDMCCAPGGKSLHIAEMMHNTGQVIGCDIFEHKLKLVENNIERLKLTNVKLINQDALKINESFLNKFDYCIVDVPCSNSGIIRRKPEVKYKISLSSLTEIKILQSQILLNASRYLKKGGKMIYSTCSIFDSENIDNINDFLKNNSNFKLKSFQINDKNVEEGFVKFFPQTDNTDGFFIACLIKN